MVAAVLLKREENTLKAQLHQTFFDISTIPRKRNEET